METKWLLLFLLILRFIIKAFTLTCSIQINVEIIFPNQTLFPKIGATFEANSKIQIIPDDWDIEFFHEF